MYIFFSCTNLSQRQFDKACTRTHPHPSSPPSLGSHLLLNSTVCTGGPGGSFLNVMENGMKRQDSLHAHVLNFLYRKGVQAFQKDFFLGGTKMSSSFHVVSQGLWEITSFSPPPSTSITHAGTISSPGNLPG